jgi:DNA primase catalytic core
MNATFSPTQHTISFTQAAEQVKAQLDVLEIIQRYVPLKKRGRNYLGLCPFHQERTPSFNVSADKGLFKCFGCGVSGDALTFLMKMHNQSYGELIREQAEEMGLHITPSHADNTVTHLPNKDERERLFYMMQLAQQWYTARLQGSAGEEGRAYLAGRGYHAEAISAYGLGLSGFSSQGWDGLSTYLLGAMPELQQQPQWLEKTGLGMPRNQGSGYYDRFRDRLMLPIYNARMQLVGFGGRSLSPEVEPKYLNSPETALYTKSQVLYGLCWAKEAIAKQQRAVVMEGYFDVLRSHVAGLGLAVATCGTALTEEHIKLLLRHGAKTVYLCFDADKAGERAAFGALERMAPWLERQAMAVRILSLPQGKDPDEFFKTESLERFEGLLQTAEDPLHFQLNHTMGQPAASGGPASVAAEPSSVASLLPILAQVQQPIRRGQLVQEYAQRLGCSAEALQSELLQYEQAERQKQQNKVLRQHNITNVKEKEAALAITSLQASSTQRNTVQPNERFVPLQQRLQRQQHAAELHLLSLALCGGSEGIQLVQPLITTATPWHNPAVQHLWHLLLSLLPHPSAAQPASSTPSSWPWPQLLAALPPAHHTLVHHLSFMVENHMQSHQLLEQPAHQVPQKASHLFTEAWHLWQRHRATHQLQQQNSNQSVQAHHPPEALPDPDAAEAEAIGLQYAVAEHTQQSPSPPQSPPLTP